MSRVRVNFAKVMKMLGIKSKRELATILEYSYRNINNLFDPDYNPRIQELARHAKKLKCKVSDLIDEQ
jgi:DNA-binding Xre family transcriptional regulator